MLKNRIGDCDSQDMLLAAMFESEGFPTQFVTIKADAERPDEYSHVYTRVKIPNYGWVVADPTMPNKYFGWEPEGNYVKKYWPASSDAVDQPVDESPSVSGMGFFGQIGDSGIIAAAAAIGLLWLTYEIGTSFLKRAHRVKKDIAKAAKPALKYVGKEFVRHKLSGGR